MHYYISIGVYPGRPPLGQGPRSGVTELPPKGEGVSVPVASCGGLTVHAARWGIKIKICIMAVVT